MKFKKDMPDEILSILGEGVEMVGEISFTHGLRVDGVVKGSVHSEGSLVVGERGKVNAEVHIQKVCINGEFRGVIRAADRVEIHKAGRVYGEIYTPCLIIEAGAVFEGKCNMSDHHDPGHHGEASLKTADSDLRSSSRPEEEVLDAFELESENAELGHSRLSQQVSVDKTWNRG